MKLKNFWPLAFISAIILVLIIGIFFNSANAFKQENSINEEYSIGGENPVSEEDNSLLMQTDPAECEGIEDPEKKNECYLNTATDNGDATLCEKVTNDFPITF